MYTRYTLLKLSLFVFLFAAMSICPALVAREIEIIESPEVTLVDEEGAGKLYRVGEHPVLVMEGTPEEMGYQHGRLLAAHIHNVLTQGYTPKALWDRGYSREYVMAQSERMDKFFPEAIREELRGLVRGLHAAGYTDLAYEDVRIGITQAEILHFPPDGPAWAPCRGPGAAVATSATAVHRRVTRVRRTRFAAAGLLWFESWQV